MSISLISDYLETYEGRDKFLRVLSYMAKLATVGITSKELKIKFEIFSNQMNESRVILRLLDDIPIIYYAMTYGLGREESDWLLRWTGLAQVAVNIVFGPVEHITWAGTHRLIKINVETWNNASTWCWISSLHLSLFRSIRRIQNIDTYKSHLEERDCDTKLLINAVSRQQKNELLTCLRLVLDISYAIGYLSPGILWGGQLKTWHVGALGTLSSLISIYQALSRQITYKFS